MKWAEAAGLVKFDFLGLKTLTVIETARKLIARRGIELDPATLPLDDAATYALLQKGDTVGVFQLEGQGMRDALRKLKPDRFEDIIAIVALYRPGPMDNIDSYVNRKHGREAIETLHPMIEPILQETYGVIIYQEQVMQIAQVLSGFSLGEADLLRRAMGKKIKKEMAAQKSRFIDGAVGNGVDRARAEYIFELVAKFAGYGFNKSHAAAYALIAYQTAYLKANHPIEFLAASMTLDMGNADKLNGFAQEARRLGLRIEPPAINRSEVDFLPGDGAIRYSLAALKNVGRQAVEHLRRSAKHADFSVTSRISPGASIRASSTSARWRRLPPPAPSTSLGSIAPPPSPMSIASSPPATGPSRRPPTARTISSRGRSRFRRRSSCALRNPGCRPTGCRASSRPSAFSSPAIRSTTIRTCSKRSAPRRGWSSPPRRASPRGGHARRDRASCARAQGQDRQSLRLCRLLGPDRSVRGGGVLRGAPGVAAAA